MLSLIALLIFGSVGLVVFELMRPKTDSLRQRIRVEQRGSQESTTTDRLEGSLFRRLIAPGFAKIGRALAALLPTHWIRAIDHLLVMADRPWSLPGFLSVWLLAILAGALLAIYASLMADLSGVQLFVIVFFTLSFASLLPYGRLRSKAGQRRKAIVRALPDAMDLLVTSVEAGMGVDASFGLVAEKSQGPLSDAFALYLKQVGLGRPRREALVYVAEQTGVPDLIEIAHNINQGEDLGTPISDVLRRLADELRAQRRQRAELAAQKAPVKMTIPLALCFLPAIGAVVIVPSILNLLKFVGTLGGG